MLTSASGFCSFTVVALASFKIVKGIEVLLDPKISCLILASVSFFLDELEEYLLALGEDESSRSVGVLSVSEVPLVSWLDLLVLLLLLLLFRLLCFLVASIAVDTPMAGSCVPGDLQVSFPLSYVLLVIVMAFMTV